MLLFALTITAIHGWLWGVTGTNTLYLWLNTRAARRTLTPSPAPHVEVLIPARNEAENLERLLPSLLAQTYAGFRVRVYDDGSEDATPEVLRRFAEAHPERLATHRGEGPPPGWVGKVHALHQATRHAERAAPDGALYLFLDADAELTDDGALERLVQRHASMEPGSVMTGLPRLLGGGRLLVSMVPNAILIGLPWVLVRRFEAPALGALNGQCWMLDAATYHCLEPHAALPDEVLEDVKIGRYLKSHGVVPVLHDLQREVRVYMYRSFGDAWRGFRKNAYLILGGRPLAFALLWLYFGATFVVGPLLFWLLLPSLFGLKLATDRINGMPLWATALAPVAYLLAWVLQLDSAIAHAIGRVDWKGRRV